MVACEANLAVSNIYVRRSIAQQQQLADVGMSGDALRAAVLHMMAYGTARAWWPISTMENLKDIMNATEKLIHKNEAFVIPDGIKKGRDNNQLLKA